MSISFVIYAGKHSFYDLSTQVLGVSLLERQILTAQTFNPTKTIVIKDEPPSGVTGKVVLLNGAYFKHPLAIKKIIDEDKVMIEEGGLFAYLDCEKQSKECAEFFEYGKISSDDTVPVTQGFNILVDSEEKKKLLIKNLFNAMRKPTDGLVARSMNKAVSFFLTEHVFIPLRVSPNMVTLIAASFGILSGIIAAEGTRSALIIGTLLAHFASILDGCDGEVARLTFKTSKAGKWFDSIADSLVNTSLMLGLGYGLKPFFGVAPVYLAWMSTGIIWFHNLVTYFDVIFVRHTTDVFAFSWWFEKKERVRDIDLSKPVYGASITLLDFLKYLSRRDFYLLVYFVLAVISPTALMIGYVLTALFTVPSFFLTIAHIYFGIIRKLRKNNNV